MICGRMKMINSVRLVPFVLMAEGVAEAGNLVEHRDRRSARRSAAR